VVRGEIRLLSGVLLCAMDVTVLIYVGCVVCAINKLWVLLRVLCVVCCVLCVVCCVLCAVCCVLCVVCCVLCVVCCVLCVVCTALEVENHGKYE
jgi:hypothetical protein